MVVNLSAGPPQDGPDSRDDLLEAEGFGDIVIAAHGQPGDLVVDRVTRRDEDDRQMAAALTQFAGHREAVHIGEHDVQDAQVGVVRGGHLECLGARARRGDVKAGKAQRRGQEFADIGLVLDDEQSSFGRRGAHGIGVWR